MYPRKLEEKDAQENRQNCKITPGQRCPRPSLENEQRLTSPNHDSQSYNQDKEVQRKHQRFEFVTTSDERSIIRLSPIRNVLSCQDHPSITCHFICQKRESNGGRRPVLKRSSQTLFPCKPVPEHIVKLLSIELANAQSERALKNKKTYSRNLCQLRVLLSE